MKSKILSFLICTILFAFFSSFFLSAQTTKVSQSDAQACLNESEAILAQMASSNLNILRVNDSLTQANLLYSAQVVLMGKKSGYDFSLVIPYCEDIKKIQQTSISALDEFHVLLQFYNLSLVPGMNTEIIDSTLNEIRDEIKNERYENVQPLINRAYNEIIDTKSSYTALNIFIDSTSRGFISFLTKNWKTLSTVIILLLIFFLVYRIKIMKAILNRKIERLELRKKTIQDLIMATQKGYFESGKISESEYNIKIKKFAELVRDIDRQIPLLREDLLKLDRKKVRNL